jgi:hypothetical protein
MKAKLNNNIEVEGTVNEIATLISLLQQTGDNTQKTANEIADAFNSLLYKQYHGIV